MHHGQPSQTARSAAAHRAIHQILEGGAIFKDPFASRILDERTAVSLNEMAADESLGPMRLFIAARSRFSEDALAACVARGEQSSVAQCLNGLGGKATRLIVRPGSGRQSLIGYFLALRNCCFVGQNSSGIDQDNSPEPVQICGHFSWSVQCVRGPSLSVATMVTALLARSQAVQSFREPT